MAGLSSAERIRERAAECRARAEHPILQADAAAWLELANTWDQLANAMEASACHAPPPNTLELLDRDPGIEAAADDLCAVVAAFVTGHQHAEHGPERRDRRVVREAFLWLEAKLAAGQPSDKARTMGLD